VANIVTFYQLQFFKLAEVYRLRQDGAHGCKGEAFEGQTPKAWKLTSSILHSEECDDEVSAMPRKETRKLQARFIVKKDGELGDIWCTGDNASRPATIVFISEV
jgi:hypothetical protein